MGERLRKYKERIKISISRGRVTLPLLAGLETHNYP